MTFWKNGPRWIVEDASVTGKINDTSNTNEGGTVAEGHTAANGMAKAKQFAAALLLSAAAAAAAPHNSWRMVHGVEAVDLPWYVKKGTTTSIVIAVFGSSNRQSLIFFVEIHIVRAKFSGADTKGTICSSSLPNLGGVIRQACSAAGKIWT